MFGRRILVLIPHPDDEVVGCSTAIGRARAQGSSVLGAYLTNGVPVSAQLWPWQRKHCEQRVVRRREEALRAAELLGMEPAWFQDIPSRQLKESLSSTQERLVALIRDQGMDTVWAPAYEGGHQDHDVANALAGSLRGVADVWEFSEYNYFGGRVRSQEFISTTGAERELSLDHSERERKRQLLGIYKSERGNLRRIRGPAFWQREVFRPLAEDDYTRAPHPGTLFYQRYQWVPFHPRVDSCKPKEVCRAMRAFLTAAQTRPAKKLF